MKLGFELKPFIWTVVACTVALVAYDKLVKPYVFKTVA